MSLSDEMVWKTAMELTQRSDIRNLGLKLGLKESTIEAAFTNYSRNIWEAAHQVLTTWKKTVPTNEAYHTLGTALRHCKLVKIAEMVLDYYQVDQ